MQTTLEHIVDKYRQLLERFPQEPSARLALAELIQLRGLRLEALLSYQETLKESPVAETRVALADVYASHGLFTQAFEELSASLEAHPRLPDAHCCAAEFAEAVTLPDGLKQALEQSCSREELARASLQLGLKRSILLRELQELAQIADRSKGDPLAAYRVEETKKRLQVLERRLHRMEQLESFRVEREVEEQRQRDLELERKRQLQELQEAAPIDAGAPETDWANDLALEPPRPPLSSGEGEVDAHTVAPADEEVHLDFTPTPVEPDLPPVHTSGLGDDLLMDTPLPEASEFILQFEEVDEASVDEQLETLRNSESGEFPAIREDVNLGDDLGPLPGIHPVEPVVAFTPQPVSPVIPVVVQPPVEQPAAPQPIPPEPVYVPEPAPLAAPPVNRAELYAKVIGEVNGLVSNLGRTRGVTSIHVVARDGFLVTAQGRESVTPERICDFVVEGLVILDAFAGNPQYWVLECSGGIVVFQVIDRNHVLVAVGQAGANFGALRFTMDKMRPQFAQILASCGDA